jgi:glutamate dehydrogenase/leucine dehydrogenase
VREGNFALSGLMGFDMAGKTVGVYGTGKIGAVCAKILIGFGCRVLATDLLRDAALEAAGVTYVPLDELLAQSGGVVVFFKSWRGGSCRLDYLSTSHRSRAMRLAARDCIRLTLRPNACVSQPDSS